MSEWISIESKLPENANLVLVWDGDCQFGHYQFKRWSVWTDNDFGTSNYVTHWMPLPDPPK